MKLIIIVVVVIVLLAGGGAAFYFLQVAPGGPSEESAGSAPVAEEPAVDPSYVDMSNLAIPIIRNRRIEKHILLRITLEMVDEDAKEDVKPFLPRIKDAFIKDMYDYYSYQPPGQTGIDTDVIKKRLKAAGERLVGKGAIRNVLIQAAFERGVRPN